MRYILKNRELTLLFIVTFLFFINETLLMPTLPIYLSGLNYTNLEIGSVLGAFALGVLALRPVAGLVTDRRSRKLALLIGLAVFFIAPPLYIFSNSFIYLLSIRFFHGIGITFFTTAYPTIVADVAPVEHRGEILGHMSIASTLAMALGPLAGVELFHAYGFHTLLFTCSLMGLLGLLLALFIHEPDKTENKSSNVSFREAIFTRVVIVSSMVVLIEALIIGGIFTFLPILLKRELDLNVGIFFLVTSITVIVFRFMGSHYSDRYGRGPMFLYPFLVVIIAVILIANIQSIGTLLVAAVLYGIGTALCVPTLTALLADHSEPWNRGSIFSFFYGAFDIGMLSAGVILGFLADLVGLRTMFLISAGMGLLAAFFFLLMIQSNCGQSVRWVALGARGSTIK